jgi:hypothetical protein
MPKKRQRREGIKPRHGTAKLQDINPAKNIPVGNAGDRDDESKPQA